MDAIEPLFDASIVPTRLGHYHVPGGGYEQVALVVDVNRVKHTVNLAVWQKDAEPERHLNVPVTGYGASDEMASFHLVSACPLRGEV